MICESKEAQQEVAASTQDEFAKFVQPLVANPSRVGCPFPYFSFRWVCRSKRNNKQPRHLYPFPSFSFRAVLKKIRNLPFSYFFLGGLGHPRSQTHGAIARNYLLRLKRKNYNVEGIVLTGGCALNVLTNQASGRRGKKGTLR